jgi:hypothetical protein
MKQGFLLVKLKSSLRKFYGRHHDLVNRYGTSEHVSQYGCFESFPFRQHFVIFVRQITCFRWNVNRNYSAILATLQITSYALGV